MKSEGVKDMAGELVQVKISTVKYMKKLRHEGLLC